MPVAAGIVGRLFISAVGAFVQMSAKPGSPAVLNRIHSFVLGQRQLMGLTVDGTVLLKNILHLRHRLLPLVCAHAFWEAYPTGFGLFHWYYIDGDRNWWSG
jgi:hypothetical protein